MSGGGFVGPSTVRLGLQVATREEAVHATAEILRGDPRVGSWDAFRASIGPKQVVELGDRTGGAVCLAHGRSDAVTNLALAAARLSAPVAGERGETLVLFFVFAIPLTMAEEYLRAVGALARACSNAKHRAALLAAPTREDFARLLAGWVA